MKKELENLKLAEGLIYQWDNWEIILKNDVKNETIWANRMQIADIFNVNPQAISKHIQNIYNEEELKKEWTSSKMELVQNESWRKVKRNVDYYNLDVLISIWYRINWITWTYFRKWATQTLKEHITKWFTINNNNIKKNYDTFMQVVEELKKLTVWICSFTLFCYKKSSFYWLK